MPLQTGSPIVSGLDCFREDKKFKASQGPVSDDEGTDSDSSSFCSYCVGMHLRRQAGRWARLGGRRRRAIAQYGTLW